MTAVTSSAAVRCRFAEPAAVRVTVTGTVAPDDFPTTPDAVTATVTVDTAEPLKAGDPTFPAAVTVAVIVRVEPPEARPAAATVDVTVDAAPPLSPAPAGDAVTVDVTVRDDCPW
jgi:hypothetical protein